MFEHSVKVPRLYKESAKILQAVIEQNESVKHLLYQKKRFNNINGIFALVCETLRRSAQIDSLLNSTKLLIKEPRLDPWLTRVLITELLWRKQRLPGESKPIQTILSYQNLLSMNLESVPQLKEATDKVQIPRYVRINRLLMSPVEAIDGFCNEGWTLVRSSRDDYSSYLSTVRSLADDQFTVDMHFPDILVFPPKTHFFDYSCYNDGSIILQNKSSYIPVFLLNPTPGSVVMDMCAAPGLKTSHMAQLMNNEGTIYAVEKDLERYESLRKHLDATWATCVKTINRDTTTLTSQDCPGVEYILVDPSCSGSGMMSRINYSESDNQVDSQRLEKLTGFQITILRHALLNFPDAKRVVYSTCSIYPEENEYVIQEIIKGKGCDHFKLVSPAEMLKGKWFNYGNEDEYPGIGGKCLYARPELDYTNGFFVAMFERKSEEEIFQDRLNNKKLSEQVKPEEQSSPEENYEDFQSTDTNVYVKKEKISETIEQSHETGKKIKEENGSLEMSNQNECIVKTEIDSARKKRKKLVDANLEDSNEHSSGHVDRSKTVKQKKVTHSEITNEEDRIATEAIKNEDNDSKENIPVDNDISIKKEKRKRRKSDVTTDYEERTDFLDGETGRKKQRKDNESILHSIGDDILVKSEKTKESDIDEESQIDRSDCVVEDSSSSKRKNKEKKYEVATIFGQNEDVSSEIFNCDNITKKKKKCKRSHEEPEIEYVEVKDEVKSEKKSKKKHKKDHEEPEIEPAEMEVDLKSERKSKKKHKKDHKEPEIKPAEMETEVKSEKKSKKKHKKDHEEPEIEPADMETEEKSEKKSKKKHKKDHEEPEIEPADMEVDLKSERKSKKKHKKDHEEPEIEPAEMEVDLKSERKSKKKHKKDHEEPEMEPADMETEVKSEKKSKKKHKKDHEEPEIAHIEVEANVKSKKKSKKKHKEGLEEPEIGNVM